MLFEVLGPLRAVAGGRELALGPRVQRRTLALLLAEPAGLGAERMVAELWPRPPATARHLVHVHVSRLRSVLDRGESESRIRLAGDRYRLRVEPDEVDAGILAERLAVARSRCESDPAAARAALVSLEGRWRGPAFDGLVEDSPLLAQEAARLARLRVDVTAARLGCDLALGRHGAVVGELERLTGEHRFDERLWHLLILALARAGRDAEGILAVDELRRLLADELGVEPSPRIAELERRIRSRDSTLRWRPPAPRTNVPAPLTSFVGRETEIGQVSELLADARLVTLTGPGGIGKSRLAIEVCRRERHRFDDGIRWIDLSVADEETALPTVARALGVTADPSRTLLDSVCDAVQDKGSLLLVLDSCEHVVGPIRHLLARVLAAAPGLRVLATSRCPVHLAAERCWPLPGLSAPDAVDLFAERARAGGLAADPGPAEAVADLCCHLDGMPLAIEMAASRSPTMSVAELRASLGDRLGMLRTRAEDVPDRHRSLAAALDWSYTSLDPASQRALDRAGVFAGPFDLPAAAAVACAGADPVDASDALADLLDSSLLAGQRLDGRPGFRMLEGVRDYCRAHLQAAGDWQAAQAAHCGHYLDLLAEAGEDLQTPAFTRWLDRIVPCYADVRQALRWSLEHEPRDRTLRAALGLHGIWYRTADPREADLWSGRMLAGSDGAPPRLRAAAHLARSFACDMLGKIGEGLEHAGAAVELFGESDDTHCLAIALWGRADLTLRLGNLGGAEADCVEALGLCRRTGDRWGRAAPLMTLALMSLFGVEPPGSPEAMAEEAVQLYRELDDPAGIAALNPLPSIAARRGDAEDAERYAREAVHAATGTAWEAAALAELAEVYLISGQVERARPVIDAELRRALDTGLEFFFRVGLFFAASVAQWSGHPDRSAVLLGASRAMLPRYGGFLDVVPRMHAELGQALGAREFQDALARGEAMPRHALLDLALSGDRSGPAAG